MVGAPRTRRRALEGSVCAAVVGAVPSTVFAVARGGGVGSSVNDVIGATRRVGVLLPPFRPGLVRGLTAHFLLSLLAGGLMAHLLPRRRSRTWGAAAGLAMGWCNLAVLGRRIPAIAELPLGPQLADNIAFGIVFAAVADRT